MTPSRFITWFQALATCGNSGKRLLTNQTFRDIYRADALDVDQRLKITSLTFLFTDLKGSTALTERIDAEAINEVKERYFTSMAAEITRLGRRDATRAVH